MPAETARFRPLQILAPDQVERLHAASLYLLERVGIELTHPRFLSLLEEAGAAVDRDQHRVWFPPALVEDLLRRAGRGHTLFGRDRGRTAVFGPGFGNFLSTAGQAHWIDMERGERRLATLQDARDAIRLGDALPEIDIVGAMATPQEIPLNVVDVHLYAELLRGTTKPCLAWVQSGRTARFIVEMLQAVAGGAEELRQHPLTEGFYEPISPLRFGSNGLDILLEFAAAGLPIGFGPMVMAAGTGPATLAGTLAQENAEILAGIALLQLAAPGTRVTYWGIPHVLDPAHGTMSFGSPEQGLLAVAMTQMARYYGFPAGVNVALSDANVADAQAGLEKGLSLLAGALAGADIYGHQGIAGADQGASLEQLVIDNEMASLVRRMLRGFDVTDETLALDVIEQVGVGGNFLAQPHTVRHFRHELWQPTLLNRRGWEQWREAGGKTLLDEAIARKHELLATHSVPPLPEDLDAEIRRIVAAAERVTGDG